jgi:hypothetical protein
MERPWMRWVLVVSGVYDATLGLAFLAAYPSIYARMGVTLPNHPGYVQFPAALVVLFGVAFLIAARAPSRHRDILWMGALLKVAYAAVTLGHWFVGSIPAPWTMFGWIDALFAVLLLMAWRTTAASAPA